MKSRFAKISAILSCALLLALTASAAGQAGQLDPKFGSGGIVSISTTQTQTSNVYFVGAVALQADGKVVVAGGIPENQGFTVPAVLRFNTNGTPDTTFGKNGVAVLANGAAGVGYGAMAIQSDGKIVVTTSAQLNLNGEVDRYTTTGHLDSSFGTKGSVVFHQIPLSGLALQQDGRILVSGLPFVSQAEVTRLNTDGSTDTSFGTNGISLPPGGSGALRVLSNGEILVQGGVVSHVIPEGTGLISRLTSDGTTDTSFGVGGQLLVPTAGFALAQNGDILTAGTLVIDPAVPSSGFAAFAYHSVGISDSSFGQNGGVLTPVPNFPNVDGVAGLGVESTGSIVELGKVSTTSFTQTAFGLARYTAQGELDASFGTGGFVTTLLGINDPSPSAIAIQTDDKIIAAGTTLASAPHGNFTTSLVVARYLAK